ncbi:beta-N-acetylhexosaminidase [Catenovulum sp. 2E275]|uniref:beta-N-acetylhexosaminidase n=1 Tax=Catenovulum sp. 2E275 TaxID=2980497 RepID=UPI0021D3DBB0|nr:beta-N-acetylhexosaminidase [Catenovulum sp. 2E275]MCU4676498.1 beta-N-acetylhexosaminidase [Catenovulum sp. 2E275]
MTALMLDLVGQEVSQEEREILAHPMVGGLILFSRNFHDVEQLTHLTDCIRQAAKKPILIAVDHEGGRVQRFREGFSPIPAMRDLKQTHPQYSTEQVCQQMGWLMAAEVQSVGIDMSFAPVLDLDGISDVITNRSFHSNPDKVIELASYFIQGMKQAGMKACGKHFPGHGSVKADSHIAAAIDERSAEEIFSRDLKVFELIIQTELLDAVMPAHVIYSQLDDKPAGFSAYWLQTILKQQLNFNGVIFSDDLSMEAASIAGDYVGKAQAALSAGCDMVLACNNSKGAISILDAHQQLKDWIHTDTNKKVQALFSRADFNLAQLQQNSLWQQANRLACSFND